MKVDNGTTNFAVYEDATEFYGMAEATLPEISQITEEVKGAGIAGAFNGAFVGHIEAMTLTLNFRSVTADAIKLAEPRNHQLDLRASQQYWDNSAGKFIQQAVKHVLMVTPTKFAPGKLAPAASAMLHNLSTLGVSLHSMCALPGSRQAEAPKVPEG